MSALLLAGCNKERPVESSSSGNCNGCHGSEGNAAPPLDTKGNQASISVGAHQKHIAANILCSTCHVVPTTTNDAGHLPTDSDGVADVTFSGDAVRGMVPPPAYDADVVHAPDRTPTCSNTYCHGNGLNNGGTEAGRTPAWNGAAMTCGSCHGAPPPENHPQSTACGSCHPGYTATTVNAATHLNGQVERPAVSGCTACHGDENRTVAAYQPAPPRALNGSTSTGVRGVGAHQKHMADATRWAPNAETVCRECHPNVGNNHPDDFTETQLVFGPLAAKDVTPAYDRASGTCSSVYCHGATLSGGAADKSVIWTGGASQAQGCGTCHGFPPPAPHPANDKSNVAITTVAQCGDCHATVTGGQLVPATHVDGHLDVGVHPASWVAAAGQPQPHGQAAMFHDAGWPGGLAECETCHSTPAERFGGNADLGSASCNACHDAAGKPNWAVPQGGRTDNCVFCHGLEANPGSDLQQAAPPTDTRGNSAATTRAVGAHQTHLAGTAIANAIACTGCHPGSDGYASVDHVDGALALSLLKPGTGTPSGSFDTAAGTCSTYCHGNFPNGKSSNVPSWTATSGQTACDACHQPQSSATAQSSAHWFHISGQGATCASCHGAGYTASAVVKATHVNGAVNMVTGTGVKYDAATRTCSGACHAPAVFGTSPAWP